MVALSGSWGLLAPSLVTMVNEADQLAPDRGTRSDGSVGDLAHQARSSFHNPLNGYVDALDLTHDPAHGWDVHKRAREVVARGDARLDHVISNRQIWSALRPYWRAYTGTNPHTLHAHFAVKRNSAGRSGTGLWWPKPTPIPAPPIALPEDDDMPKFEFFAVSNGKSYVIGPNGDVGELSATEVDAAKKAGWVFKKIPLSAWNKGT